MNTLKISCFALLLILSLNSFGQQNLPVKKNYSEYSTSPAQKTTANDTLMDRFIVIEEEKLLSMDSLVISFDTGDKIYKTKDLLNDDSIYKDTDGRLFIPAGKASARKDYSVKKLEVPMDEVNVLNIPQTDGFNRRPVKEFTGIPVVEQEETETETDPNK